MNYDAWKTTDPSAEFLGNPDPTPEEQRDDWLAEMQAKHGIIHTNYEHPPIPVRSCDWTAVTDDYDGAPDAGPQYVGHGATENEAIRDLIEQLEEVE